MLKFESPSKWNLDDSFNFEHWWARIEVSETIYIYIGLQWPKIHCTVNVCTKYYSNKGIKEDSSSFSVKIPRTPEIWMIQRVVDESPWPWKDGPTTVEKTVEVDELWMKINICVASSTWHICQSNTKCPCQRSRVKAFSEHCLLRGYILIF